jgi:hypothetical protein
MLQSSLRMLMVGAFLGSAGGLSAAPMIFQLQGVGDANNTATVIFSYNPGTATISIDITNTSANFDPRLTGFAFNAPSNVTGIASFSGPSGWSGSFSADSIDTPGQYGKFDIAGTTGPNVSGGNPNAGIPKGSTYHFEIVLSGSGLGALDESSFLSLLSYDAAGPPNEDEQYFIARFQQTGSNGQGSDVAIPIGPPAPIPEPATALLAGMAALGLGYLRRRKAS